MNWLVVLGMAVVLVAVAAVTGAKAKGTRHVSHTRMMGVGRVMLVILAVILGLVAFHLRG